MTTLIDILKDEDFTTTSSPRERITRIDEFTRLVTFSDGTQVTVLRGWKRLGGEGWVGGEQTYRSIREAARAERSRRRRATS